jgi:hypothetical protein
MYIWRADAWRLTEFELFFIFFYHELHELTRTATRYGLKVRGVRGKINMEQLRENVIN